MSEKSFTCFINTKTMRTIQVRARNVDEAKRIAQADLNRIWHDRSPNPLCAMKNLPIADEIVMHVEEEVGTTFLANSHQDCNSQGPG